MQQKILFPGRANVRNVTEPELWSFSIATFPELGNQDSKEYPTQALAETASKFLPCVCTRRRACACVMLHACACVCVCVCVCVWRRRDNPLVGHKSHLPGLT